MINNNKHNSQNTEIIEDNITDSRGLHPNSIKNLKKFEKGQSGNPLGSGIKYNKLAKALKSKADYVAPDIDLSDKTNKEKVIDTIWSEAKEGNIKYVELLARLGCLD